MAESLLDFAHRPFKYVKISADPIEEIEVRDFLGGTEADFQTGLREHFVSVGLSDKQKFALGLTLKSDVTKQIESSGDEKAGVSDVENQISSHFNPDELADAASSNYQIVPLTVPTKANGYTAINAYIDAVGRVKDLPVNARASRITSDDIRGDCFLSKTFDDETDFKRLDFTKEEFDELLKNPPSKAGRWDPSTAMANLRGNGEEALKQMIDKSSTESQVIKCNNCFKESNDSSSTVKFVQCSRCKKVCTACRIDLSVSRV